MSSIVNNTIPSDTYNYLEEYSISLWRLLIDEEGYDEECDISNIKGYLEVNLLDSIRQQTITPKRLLEICMYLQFNFDPEDALIPWYDTPRFGYDRHDKHTFLFNKLRDTLFTFGVNDFLIPSWSWKVADKEKVLNILNELCNFHGLQMDGNDDEDDDDEPEYGPNHRFTDLDISFEELTRRFAENPDN